MRYVAAYLLAQMGGQEKPSDANIKTILSSVGVDCEAEKMKKVLSELNGKNVSELIAEGEKDLATVPMGGGGGGAAAVAAPADDGAAKAADKEPAKKEKEPSSESDDDIGMNLFG